MIDDDTIVKALGGAGGASAIVLLARWIFRQITGGFVDARSDTARADIIGDLRSELDRLRVTDMQRDQRLAELEVRVAELSHTLMSARARVLIAHAVVLHNDPLSGAQRAQVIEHLSLVLEGGEK